MENLLFFFRPVMLAKVRATMVSSLFREMVLLDVVVSKLVRTNDNKHKQINKELTSRPILSMDMVEQDATQLFGQVEDLKVFIRGTDIAGMDFE